MTYNDYLQQYAHLFHEKYDKVRNTIPDAVPSDSQLVAQFTGKVPLTSNTGQIGVQKESYQSTYQEVNLDNILPESKLYMTFEDAFQNLRDGGNAATNLRDLNEYYTQLKNKEKSQNLNPADGSTATSSNQDNK
ncbi:hypothetical protein [Capybara microvirus Cap1_SP_127]|nr:hypothetical protein [Capybara microvirus Cap1_SP_127]